MGRLVSRICNAALARNVLLRRVTFCNRFDCIQNTRNFRQKQNHCCTSRTNTKVDMVRHRMSQSVRKDRASMKRMMMKRCSSMESMAVVIGNNSGNHENSGSSSGQKTTTMTTTVYVPEKA